MQARSISLLLMMLAAGVAVVSPDPCRADWSTGAHDNQRTSRTSVVGPDHATASYAAVSTGSQRTPSSAVEGPSGQVYVSRTQDVVAVDPATGTVLWSALGGSATLTPPVVGPGLTLAGGTGETITVGRAAGGAGTVSRLDESGQTLWSHTFPTGFFRFGALSVDDSGNTLGRYRDSQGNEWHAFKLDSSGGVLWEVAVVGYFLDEAGAGALTDDGDLVFTHGNNTNFGNVSRFDGGDGSVVWTVPMPNPLSYPVLSDNGLVLVNSNGNVGQTGLYAYDVATGSLAWQTNYPESTSYPDNPPVLLHDGDAVITTDEPGFNARIVLRISTVDGSISGSVPFPTTHDYTHPIVGGDDKMYVWTGANLMSFSPYTGSVHFLYYAMGPSGCIDWSPPTILADGSLFASWWRRQTCNASTGISEWVTLAPPVTIPDCSGNAAPVAVISGPVDPIEPGAGTLLDGSASSDPDGNLMYYEWREYFDFNDTYGFILSLDPTYSFVGSNIGPDSRVRTFELRVTDACDLIDTTRWDVTILPENTIVSPQAGDVWPVGSEQSIQWMAGTGPTNRVVQVSRNGGGSWETIDVTPNDGEYTWVVTGPETEQAKVRVFPAGNTNTQQQSGLFTIGADPADAPGGMFPLETRLLHAFPNPTSSRVEIGFQLASEVRVSLEVFDVRARFAARVRDATRQVTGRPGTASERRTAVDPASALQALGRRPAGATGSCRSSVEGAPRWVWRRAEDLARPASGLASRRRPGPVDQGLVGVADRHPMQAPRGSCGGRGGC
ncbi:MAG: PQQ-binding-like beta-propeller repeat protein [Candidatus Eisenbacteria bacterium]